MSEFDKNIEQETEAVDSAQDMAAQAAEDAAQAEETLRPHADLAASLPGFDDVEETVVQAPVDTPPVDTPVEPLPMISADEV
ncbi:MAG: hypothetical protein II128_07260, partial [Atopobiaceae bacterium]|nr:hypothetical protein [Atopobiaceae bacterium]